MTDHPRHHPGAANGAATGMFDPFATLDGGLVEGFASIGVPWANGFAPLPAGPVMVAPTTALAPDSSVTAATSSDTASPAGGIAARPAASTGGLVINVSYDSSVSTATAAEQSGLQAAVNSAVSFMESMFTNNVTLTIDVGWGEVGGQSIPSGAVAASTSTGNQLSYRTLRSDLTTTYSSGGSSYQTQAANALPGSDPTGSTVTNDFYVSQAEEKALGVRLFGGGSAIDGSIGLGALSNWNFGTTGVRAIAGQYDAIGAIEHEISEVMGRVGSLGTLFGSGIYTPLDLFRYSGTNALTPSSGSGSFSTNGQRLTLPFNDPFTAGGDAGDWASSVSGDAFGYSTAGSAETVSATDLQVMNVLGWNLSASGLTAAGNCFAAGTRIATADGEAPVDALAPGTLVRTRFGGLAPIRWIGRWRVDCRRHKDAMPVRIAPHAFGPGAPARPLWLSPEHAVAVEGALIPIRLLVNGASIAFDRAARRVTYLHLRLDRHDLLLAEGLEAESFLDAHAPAWLDPPVAQQRRETASCLPLRTAPAAVAPVWEALAARSAALGLPVPRPAVTADPAPRLRVGGRRVAPLARGPGHAVFALPDAAPGWLVSRRTVPAALAAWREDRRLLGVRVRELRWRHGARTETIAADDPRLRSGWWPAERDGVTPWRWTDGAGRLPMTGGVVEVAFSPAPAYPAEAEG
ncbi:MAG: NF038122 family metalloprotease [Acetobacteraceae bacterium]